MGRHFGGAVLFVGLASLSLVKCSCGDTESEDTHKGKDASIENGGDSGEEASDDAGEDAFEASVPGITAGSCGALGWAMHYGGDEPGQLTSDEAALAVVSDAAGNSYFTGNYRGDADFGGGPLIAGKENRSLFLLKLDPNGKHVYSHGFGDPSGGVIYAPQARGHGIALLPNDGVIVVGSFAGTIDPKTGSTLSSNDPLFADAGGGCFPCSSDILVMAFDATGKTVWAKGFGGQEGEVATAVVTDASGNAFVAGTFETTLDLGGGISLTSAGKSDGFVMKLDPDGVPLWAERFGGSGDDGANALMLEASGSVLVGGAFTGSATIGAKTLTASGDYDGVYVTLDAAGKITDSRALGASERGTVTGLAARTGGGYVAVGAARGTVSFAGKSEMTRYLDAFVVSVDGADTEDWGKIFGADNNDSATGVAIAPNGNLLISASISYGQLDLGGGPLAFKYSDGGVVLELDSSGKHLCSRRYSADSLDEPIGDSGNTFLGGALDVFAVAADPSGGAVIAGGFSGTTDLGGGTIDSSGSRDALCAKFNQ